MEKPREKCQECLVRRKGIWRQWRDYCPETEELVESCWAKKRAVLQEAHRCDIEGCGKTNMFSSRQRNFSSRWSMMSKEFAGQKGECPQMEDHYAWCRRWCGQIWKSGKHLTNGRHIGKTSRTSGMASWAVWSSRAQLRQSYLQRSLNWTGEWNMQLFKKLGCSSNPREWNSIWQINWLIKHKREKSWLCNKLEMKSRAFQEDRARSCQEIEELRRICCTEAERARQLRIDEISAQEEGSKSTVYHLTID